MAKSTWIFKRGGGTRPQNLKRSQDLGLLWLLGLNGHRQRSDPCKFHASVRSTPIAEQPHKWWRLILTTRAWVLGLPTANCFYTGSLTKTLCSGTVLATYVLAPLLSTSVRIMLHRLNFGDPCQPLSRGTFQLQKRPYRLHA